MKKIRVILCQKQLGVPVTRKEISSMKDFAPHFVCFPEYFFVNRNLGTLAQSAHNQSQQLKRIRLLSEVIQTCVIGGTMPEMADGALYNTSFIFDRGRLLGFYRKKNLFFAEVKQITPGKNFSFFTSSGIKFSVMICADVFYDDTFSYMKSNGVKIIFSPTFSLFKNETVEEKFKRDHDIYAAGAAKSDAVIVKVCGVKSDFKNFLQARSLIALPEKIQFRVNPEEENKSMLIMKEIEIL